MPFTTVNEYLDALPADQRAALEHLRSLIRGAAPDAIEVISYQIPTYKHRDKVLVSIGAAKNHCAIYAIGNDFIEAHAAELEGYSRSGKGTLRFTVEKPLPDKLVAQLIETRIAEVDAGIEQAQARRAANRKAKAG